jgi:hypothetical protein
MTFTPVFPTSPGIGIRVLVKQADGKTCHAARFRNTPCEGSHWINDQGVIIRNVIGWTFVIGTAEVE